MTEHAEQLETDDVDPAELTSPGTVQDPELEQQRAAEAAERERESRASDRTKYDELRDRQEQEAADRTARVADVPDARDD